ncbi:MAG: Crp/Fnr family transcriptional regulator [Anaerolineales bacterium]|jgi:CRP-like cAMP-binding protein
MPDRVKKIDQLLSSVGYFSGLDETTLKAVKQAAIPRSYDPGQLIILEGEPNSGLYLIELGWVKVVKIAVDGREQVLRFLGPGEAFNAISVLTGTPNPASVVALEKTHLWVLLRDTMQRLIDEHPTLAKQMIQDLAGRVLHLISLVDDLSLRTVEARLARLLVEQAVGDKVYRKKWATQAEMAARLGTVPDVLSRSLRNLAEQGVIQVERSLIQILDMEALEQKANLS